MNEGADLIRALIELDAYERRVNEDRRRRQARRRVVRRAGLVALTVVTLGGAGPLASEMWDD